MGTRFLYGIAMVLALIGLLYFDHATGWSFGLFALCVIVTATASVEIGRLLKARGVPFDRNLVILLGLASLCYAQFAAAPPDVGGLGALTRGEPRMFFNLGGVYPHLLLLVPAPVLLICSFHALSSRNVPDMSARLFTNLGVYIYLVFPIVLIAWMRRVPGGGEWLLYLLIAGSRTGDIGAYLGGTVLGRHKLIPHLSPGKSVEGALCGLVFSASGGALIAVWAEAAGGALRPLFSQWWHGALVGAVIGFAAQCGDLVKSAIKRAAGVKDSGAIVPAFGGVLDLVDNFMLSGPLLLVIVALWP